MLQAKNETPFAATICVFNNPDGVESVYGVVKATFEIHGGQLIAAAKQLPFSPVDVFLDDPANSSLASAGDLTMCKPATDVVLVGNAYATNGLQREMDVELKVEEQTKSIRVIGDRVWKEGVLGCRSTDPEPFEIMPLVFERAFGGTDEAPRDEDAVDFEPRNPVGCGLVPKNSKSNPNGKPLPNLEDPSSLIKSPSDRPAPACLAPIAPHWQPRRSFAGTYDQKWESGRAPFLPTDFDSRFFNFAAPEMMFESFLKGGEQIEIKGVSPHGPIAFTLPPCDVEHGYDMGGKTYTYPADLDTVVIEPDHGRVVLLWRSIHVVDKDLLRMKTFSARCHQYPKLRAAS